MVASSSADIKIVLCNEEIRTIVKHNLNYRQLFILLVRYFHHFHRWLKIQNRTFNRTFPDIKTLNKWKFLALILFLHCGEISGVFTTATTKSRSKKNFTILNVKYAIHFYFCQKQRVNILLFKATTLSIMY